MSVCVLTDITTDRPIDEVSTYASDPSHAPEWYANIESVEWKSPSSNGTRAATRQTRPANRSSPRVSSTMAAASSTIPARRYAMLTRASR